MNEKDFEKLGIFYLGKHYDLDQQKITDHPLLYESKDLLTHALCVGMTGSGKTGLGITLIEEAVLDGIPCILMDPKGDLSNLLLTFPSLSGPEFEPWIDEEEARRNGLNPAEFAHRQAEVWRDGLLQWNQDGERIRRLRNSAEFAIYTPASSSGLPISILSSFAAPPAPVLSDPEVLRDRIRTTVSSILALLGIDGDSFQNREHILLSTILETSWRRGENLDLPALIHRIQTPPVTTIGVMDLESFFPAQERFQLAMRINNLVAAPGFDLWLKGAPLNPDSLFFTSAGKPRVSILSISHLSDAERMFFVSLFLTRLLDWVRTQPGTGTLRALFYMDEISGYFPPVANPPSKQPLLTLVKQARAFGLGIVLATQNPVDLDYKGLANTGTWFIGRLQTERDKLRLLDGLESASHLYGNPLDRQRIEQTIGSLSSRVFLLHNVHEDQPAIFHTRWALCYLRGPLSREEIRRLTESIPRETEKQPESLRTVVPETPLQKNRPVLPPEIEQYFVQTPSIESVVYKPFLLASASAYYADARLAIATEQKFLFIIEPPSGTGALSWELAEPLQIGEEQLDPFPVEGALYQELPAMAARAASYRVWRRSFQEWIYRTKSLKLYRSVLFGETSRPEETERDFRIRLQRVAREQRDRMMEKARQRYANRIAVLQDRIRRAEQTVEREKIQAREQKVQTAISFGTTLLGAMFGRRRFSYGTLGRVATTAKGVGRTMKESEDIQRAQENVEVLKKQLQDLESQLESEIAEIVTKVDPVKENFETLELRPKKSNITVHRIALLWMPLALTAREP